MPQFLGIQYEPLPPYQYDSCTMMDGMAANSSDIKTRLDSATSWTLVFNKMIDSLAVYGISGDPSAFDYLDEQGDDQVDPVALRDVQPEFTLSMMLSAAAAWEVYIGGWQQYMSDYRGVVDGLLASNLPRNQLMFWYADNASFTLEIGDDNDMGLYDPPVCGYWKNKIENDIVPGLELAEQKLANAKNVLAGTGELITKFQEGLIGQLELNNSIQALYAQNLALIEQNEAAEQAILQSRFLHNVSQFSIVGAAVVLGADQLKLLK